MFNGYVGYVMVSTKIHCRSLNQPQVHSIAVFWSISRAGEASRTTLAARRNHVIQRSVNSHQYKDIVLPVDRCCQRGNIRTVWNTVADVKLEHEREYRSGSATLTRSIGCDHIMWLALISPILSVLSLYLPLFRCLNLNLEERFECCHIEHSVLTFHCMHVLSPRVKRKWRTQQQRCCTWECFPTCHSMWWVIND